jgi:hypothetical protein
MPPPKPPSCVFLFAFFRGNPSQRDGNRKTAQPSCTVRTWQLRRPNKSHVETRKTDSRRQSFGGEEETPVLRAKQSMNHATNRACIPCLYPRSSERATSEGAEGIAARPRDGSRGKVTADGRRRRRRRLPATFLLLPGSACFAEGGGELIRPAIGIPGECRGKRVKEQAVEDTRSKVIDGAVRLEGQVAGQRALFHAL